MAGCQRNKLFTPRDEKWVWHHNQAADALLDRGCKKCLKIAFSAGGQHLQVLLKTVGRRPNFGLISFDVHVAGICEQSDCVGGREKLISWARTPDTQAVAQPRSPMNPRRFIGYLPQTRGGR